jgi:recombination DNA repair RAD52 pathway protein
MSKLIVSEKDLSLSENGMLNKNQLQHLLRVTPAKYVRERPGKGGSKWKYVSGGYVKKVLNLMFGWDWDFEIMEQQILHGEAIVKGKLTCRMDNRVIVKMQFGNKDIMYKRETDANNERIPLSIGNDLKAAATDALKKCAAEIGIAADIYNPEEFREIQVESKDTFEDMLAQIKDLLSKYGEFVDPETLPHIENVVKGEVTASYQKCLTLLLETKKEIEG